MSNDDITQFDIGQVASSFNRAAKTYDDVAILQREVATRTLSRLEVMTIKPQLIVDIGAGTGYASELLKQAYKDACVYSVDLAIDLLQHGKQQDKLDDHFFICADTIKLPFKNNSVDFVFSNLMLQWCSDINAVFAEWQRVLKPEGLLMFSSLGPDTFKELRMSWAEVDDKPHVHSFIDMHHLGDALLHNGFVDPVMDVEMIQVHFADVNEFMRDLKQLGVHNLDEQRQRGLTGKSKFKKMLKAYEQHRTEDNKIPASYEVVYGHAWGSDFVKSGQGEFVVPISKIQR